MTKQSKATEWQGRGLTTTSQSTDASGTSERDLVVLSSTCGGDFDAFEGVPRFAPSPRSGLSRFLEDRTTSTDGFPPLFKKSSCMRKSSSSVSPRFGRASSGISMSTPRRSCTVRQIQQCQHRQLGGSMAEGCDFWTKYQTNDWDLDDRGLATNINSNHHQEIKHSVPFKTCSNVNMEKPE